ncbi:hypothetical protein EYC08_17740 [Tabrizicola sp. WMC-M-20]|nr:hypothetical protein EYC08_17740 [Tabrizicola sp. WMC-M-20]
MKADILADLLLPFAQNLIACKQGIAGVATLGRYKGCDGTVANCPWRHPKHMQKVGWQGITTFRIMPKPDSNSIWRCLLRPDSQDAVGPGIVMNGGHCVMRGCAAPVC